MTREETVRNLLTELIDMIDNGSQRDLDKADEIGASIIKLFEQEPCKDAISRAKARNCITGNELRARMVQDLDALPSVSPKQRKTSWVRGKNDSTLFFCRRCGKGVNPYWKYCPHCGAKMEVEE